MTFKYNNVFMNETATICGHLEKEGPLKIYFDKTYDDFYLGEDSTEKAEIKLVKDAVVLLLKKSGILKEDVDLVVGGDLLNQLVASTYGTSGVGKSFIGVYGACSSSVLAMIIASNFIDRGLIKNAICEVSSHNLASEKQFRNPVEYGTPKNDSCTFTSTGSAACLLSNNESKVKVECATLGKIVDYEQNDVNDMGRVMAPAAYETMKKHFEDTGRNPDYYDLILTGDLGVYGKEILTDFMKEAGYKLSNYDDCGVLLYDLDKQKEVRAGGSGPVCSALVTLGYIFEKLKEKELKKVLIVATGALFSPTIIHQGENIYSIAHAISLEAE